jgi:mono/diheme cytochrome c family protein
LRAGFRYLPWRAICGDVDEEDVVNFRVRALWLALLVSGPAVATTAPDGRALYQQRCASCHGEDARGDGPDAEICATRPTNLRADTLADNSTGALVHEILDGRSLGFDVAAMKAHAADTEALVIYLQHLPDVDWRAVDAGKALYVDRCAPCHGAYGRGGAVLPPGVRTPRDLADPAWQRSVSESDLIVAVRHGRAGMPALTPRLSDTQAHQVAAFVRLLSPGYMTYAQYCAGCHGDHGVGGGSFAESYPAPTVIFDRAYFARHDGEELRRKAWHMLDEHRLEMPHFRGTLTPAQARAIVDYLKSGRAH